MVFSDEEAMLTSNVAIDDIYIRGKEWNKREPKNFKAGNRTAGKTAAVGAKEDCCNVAAKPVPTADAAAFGGGSWRKLKTRFPQTNPVPKGSSWSTLRTRRTVERESTCALQSKSASLRGPGHFLSVAVTKSNNA